MSKKIKTKIKWIFSPKLITAALAIFVIVSPNFAQARTFDPNQIITDQELLNKDALTKAAIQKFLEREDSVLARYSQIVDNRTLKAAEIIWEVGQKHNINPKFLLTTLEKEQALINKSQATEKALDWATGYGCYNGTCKEKNRGFYNQVEATAETQQIYWQKAGQFAFRVGQAATTYDGFKLVPQNQATANLYIYTPYVGNSPELGIVSRYGGNRLFWRIWQRYFTNQKFLDGQIITNNGNYWLVENNKKRKFASLEIFEKDYKTSEAINVNSQDLTAYPDGPTINFADNTLVKSEASGQIFLLSGKTKRPIIDNAALTLLSDFNIAVTESEIPAVLEDRLASYNLGTLISVASIYPQGKLFQDEIGQIWLVQNNLKHLVDPMVWQNRFNNKSLIIIDSDELAKYPTGEVVKLKDGTFVYANDNYYLISNGERMKIQDEEIFNRTFGQAKKDLARRITTTLLEVHSAGEMIDYINDTIQDSAVDITPTPIATNYAAEFSTVEPDGLILVNGQSQLVTVKFKNLGTTVWQNGNVWLQATDKDGTTSSFTAAAKINFSESSVGQNQLATFEFNLTAPTDKSGLLNQEFALYYDKNGAAEKITSVSKFIIVKPGTAGQILDHNIPVAVRNTWKPITIKMKIKNLSPDQTWLSKKTALEIYNGDGKVSPFYDKNDWVRKEVAAVPTNKTKIKPGEVGEFTFTLDPRGLKPGNYILNFQLKMLDQGKEVLLNGQEEWHREIRVDK